MMKQTGTMTIAVKGEKTRMNKKRYIPVLLLMTLAGCSGLKHLPPGEALYVKGDVHIETDTIPERFIEPLEERLEELLSPQPTGSFLGMRPQLAIYNWAGDSATGIKRWIKRTLGRPPVFLSDVNREYNENLLRNRLENLGFFNAAVSSDTTVKNRQASVHYTAAPHIPYRIKSVQYETGDSEAGKAIKALAEGSLLTPGRPFNLDHIISERERIDNELKNKGFYYFSPDYILVETDSTIGSHHVNMYVTLKKETPQQALQPYTINDIYVFPNYNLTQTQFRADRFKEKLIENKGVYFYDPEFTYRPFALNRAIFFKKGDLYNRHNHNLTISQLVGIGSFKFVKNSFVDVDSGKTNKLDVYYYLTPAPKKAIRLELLGKTASVYNGFETNLSWRHRNAFKSGELFRISVYGGAEVQTGGNVNLNSTFYRYGTEASLSFPRLIAPFDWQPSRRFVPRTTITAGYEFLNRLNSYSLNSMRLSFGYQWKETEKKEHELDVFEIGYVQPRNITPEYEAQIDTIPTLRHAIERQFTFGPNYNFTFTNTMDEGRTHTQYFKGGVDLSGNVYGLIKGADYNAGRVYQIFNADFSQYIKAEADFRNYTKLTRNSQLAARAMFGYGYSYGNSVMLPYVKQYFVGGPNSLRAFRARALGPGSYEPPRLGENNFIPDQTGDVKLELNAEYRAKLVSVVHWAAFVDAGNIWLQNESEDKPGARFGKDFLKELAVGAGLGLRFDFSYLVLRTDFAIPLRIPYLPENERWVFDDINFRDPEWRRNNLVFNLAIGYPF